MTKSLTGLDAALIFDGTQWLRDHVVMIEAGRIVDVLAYADSARYGDVPREHLPKGTILAPGLIDLQVNGGGGVLLNDQPTVDGIRKIAQAHRQFGSTALLPTLITDHPDVLDKLLDTLPAALALPGVVGVHIEGPFINPARKGVHRNDLIRPLDARGMAQLQRLAACGRSMVTVAPECLAPGQIEHLVSLGLRVSVGHSDASAAHIQRATSAGLTCATHLFNAMSQVTPREPGVVGAVLDSATLYAGIIADGHHVAGANLRLALTCLGRDRLLLVTDAMPSVGAATPQFALNGRPITLVGGRLTDQSGTLAGAHLSMIEAVRNMIAASGCTLADALIMASRTPAAYLGLAQSHGRIAPGFRADIIAFNAGDLTVTKTWINGAAQTH